MKKMGEEEIFAAAAYRWGLPLYKAGITAFFAAGGLRRLRKKYAVGLEERMGLFGAGVPADALWVHAVSVGEVQSASALLEAAKEDSSLPCVLSTVTATGRAMAEKLGTPRAATIYNPWDVPRFVRRALDHLRPRVYVAMETERWPTLLSELRKRKIPAFLVNGRLSEKSTARLLKTRSFWRGVLCCFERLLVRFESDREHFLALGVPEEKIVVTGDCKVDAMQARKQAMDPACWGFLRRGDAPLFLAGSTHPGEEETILQAFSALKNVYPNARLVIAPRHPERALEVVALALPYGKADRLSDLSADGDVVVVDRIGVLFELYAAVDAAFVGGSLVRKGGQNLMEPALFGIPVTHGPDTFNFPDTPRMDAIGAARNIDDAFQLASAWREALDPAARERSKKACEAYFKTVGGAARRSWEVIRPFAKI